MPIVTINGLPCDVCGGAVRHVPNCDRPLTVTVEPSPLPPPTPTTIAMIQLKWSDEKEWKDYEKAIDFSVKTPEEQFAALRWKWNRDKDKYKLNHDVEFRIVISEKP